LAECAVHQRKNRVTLVIKETRRWFYYLAIDGDVWHEHKSNITYLEPPRPLRNGHTKEEILTAYLDGDADRVHKDSRTANEYYDATFPTATAPTEEIKGPTCAQCKKELGLNAISTSTGDMVCSVKCEKEFMKPSAPSPQPQPSFTREQIPTLDNFKKLLLDGDLIVTPFLQNRSNTLVGFKNKGKWEIKWCDWSELSELPTRLDLLIKWWGEQERPSELEFRQAREREMSSHMYWNITKSPQADSTHYRRGTSEWIELPTESETP
jgi:hypothetical protein